MKKFFIAILSLLLLETTAGINAAIELSDNAKIYLVSCEPGNEIYERFGHTGIRVCDPDNNIDVVVHWGLFSFDTPNFAGRFISGETDYEMGIFPTKIFLKEYIKRGSTVHEQELNFTQDQKQDMWEEIKINYLPENRKYRYDFIHDNCATRPYKMIVEQFSPYVRTDYDLGIATYREIIDFYVPRYSWWNCGINMIIGNKADQPIGMLESVAFPMYTMNAVEKCSVIRDSIEVPIISSNDVLYQAPRKEKPKVWLHYCINLILPVFILALLIAYYIKHKHYIPWITPIILIFSGLAGCLICYLWFLSEHPLVESNFNILWLNPINLILGIWMLFRRKCIRIKSILAMITLVFALMHSFVFVLGIQETTGLMFSLFVIVVSALTSTILTYRATLKKIFTPIKLKAKKNKKTDEHKHHHHSK